MKERREEHRRRQDRVAEIIKKRGGSYADFAELVGVNPNTVSRWFMDPEKSGHQNIGDENARKIEKALDMEPGALDRADDMVDRNLDVPHGWPFSQTLRAKFVRLSRDRQLILEGIMLQSIERLLSEQAREKKQESRKVRQKRA